MKKTFARYVLSSVLGMLGLSCYILADTFFISRALGGKGLTALNLAIPVYSVIHGAGLMLGVGGATRFSILQAQGKRETANAVFTGTVIWGTVLALAFVLLGIFGAKALTHLMGADEQVFDMTCTYLRMILVFAPAFLLNETFLAFVRNDGAPGLAMAGMLGGSFGNVLLDYIFMFLLKGGIFGAVLATCLAPLISLAMMLPFFLKRQNSFHLVKKPTLGGILPGGVPSLLGEVSAAVVMIVFNARMLQLHGNQGVAAYSVIANLSLVAIAVFNGIAQGAQPLMSRAYGMGKAENAHTLLRWSVALALAVSAALYAGVFLLAEEITAVFNQENDLVMAAIAANGLRLYFTGAFGAGASIALCAYLISVEHERPAQVLSLLRGFVLIVPLALVMSYLWQADGLWLSFAAAEGLTLLIGAFWLLK